MVTMAESPSIHVWLQEEPIDEMQFANIPESSCGAFLTFFGKTREEHHKSHGELVGLHYTAHHELAVEELKSIATNVAAEHHCIHVSICHKLGLVQVGEPSVAVRVASPHRNSALKAVESIMNLLKSSVPIWKEEHWSSGKTWSKGTPIT